MANLSKHVGASISAELYEKFTTHCGRYRKSVSQAITELIAAWVDRPDLAGSHKATSPVIERHILKADIAVEQIRAGSTAGWKNLMEAINDLIFQNQMAMTKRYIDQGIKVAARTYGEDSQLAKDMLMLRSLHETRSASLTWGQSCLWQSGYPSSAGFYLVVPKSGNPRFSTISDDNHPDIKNQDIECHLRVSPPPKGKLQNKLRTEILPDPVDQQEQFPTRHFREAMIHHCLKSDPYHQASQ